MLRLLAPGFLAADSDFARELSRLTGGSGYVPSGEDLRRVAAMVQRIKANLYKDGAVEAPGQATRYRLVIQVLGEAVATPVAAEVFAAAVELAAATPATQGDERDGLLLAIASMQRATDLAGALATARRIAGTTTRAAALAE